MIKVKTNNKPTKKRTQLRFKGELPFLCYDIVIKAIFTDEVNILAKMISDISGIPYSALKDNTTLITNEIPINSKDEKAKRCDFVIKVTNGNIISLEVNSSYYEGMNSKNLSYLFGEYIAMFKTGEKYNENMYALQVNLNCFKNRKAKDLAKYVLQEVDDHDIYTNTLAIFNLNVEKCNGKYYTLVKQGKYIPNYIRWAALIYCRDFSKIPEIAKGILTKEEVERVMDKIYKLQNDDLFITELEARRISEWEEKSKIAHALNTGKEEGRHEGIKENTIDMIKNMFANNLEINVISKITNKSIDEINKIIME